MAARWNSSRAPHGPRNRSLFRPRIRFRCANRISTFFRSLQEIPYSVVRAIARARSRDGSYTDLVVDFHPELTWVWSEPQGLDHGGHPN